MADRQRPGEVRDAIRGYLQGVRGEASVAQIRAGVELALGKQVPPSSVRSSLRLSSLFSQTSRGKYKLSGR
jgi:hypothetical protein